MREILRNRRRCYHASAVIRLIAIPAFASLLLLGACTGTEGDDQEDEPGAATAETDFEIDAEAADLERIGLVASELSDLSETSSVVVGSNALVDGPDQLIEFYRTVQPNVNEPALNRRLSRLELQGAHTRTFVFGDGQTGVVQVLYLFANGDEASRYIGAPPAGYEDEAQNERDVDAVGDQTVAFEGEFENEDAPRGFATILTRYDNLVSQVIVGTTGVEDPFVAALELTQRQDARVQDFIAGERLTSLSEEQQIDSAPDPRVQQLADLLLVAGDLDGYGSFEVIAEVPNDNPTAVIAFLSNSDEINDDLATLLEDSGFIIGFGRLLGSGNLDEQGLAAVSQVLQFDLADGAVAFLNGSTELDIGALPASEHAVDIGDAARAFCRTRENGRFDCELRFARDNLFAAVAVLNFNDEASGLAAITDLSGIVDQLILDRP